jgi:hypothetical protein
MPARNPEAVRHRAVAAARERAGRPATPALDPAFMTLNPGALPARERPAAELHEWVRRDEEYAILGANWAIIRRADRSHRRRENREQRGERRQADRASRTHRTHQPREGDGY